MKKTFAIAALALLVAGAAQAQTANITATAIVAGPLSLTSSSNLDFGTVIPGTARTIDPLTSASAGTFVFSGGPNAQLALTWTLPANLTSGANNLPVSFAPVFNSANAQAGATALTTPTDNTRRLSGTGTGYIWVGGTATPAVAQAAGTYTGTITLAYGYTGN